MRATRAVVGALLGAVAVSGLAGPAFGKDDDDDRPTVATLPAIHWTAATAELRAQVKTGDRDARYRFQYGTSTSYGASTSWQEVDESRATQVVSRPVTGLTPNTTYYFRVVASDDHGENTVYGAARSFTTSANTPPGLAPDGPQPPATAPTAPTLGASVGVAPRQGSVAVKRPGKGRYERLKAGSVVPLGSLVDATRGSLSLTSELPSGKTQTGSFGGGKFLVRQGRGGYVDLYLRGPACTRARKGAVSATTSKRKRKRRLFGRDRGGRFRTHGRNSHATVRGTRWMVEDSCKGTLTRVTEGAVVVTDRVKKKRVLVKAGGRYLARNRR